MIVNSVHIIYKVEDGLHTAVNYFIKFTVSLSYYSSLLSYFGKFTINLLFKYISFVDTIYPNLLLIS